MSRVPHLLLLLFVVIVNTRAARAEDPTRVDLTDDEFNNALDALGSQILPSVDVIVGAVDVISDFQDESAAIILQYNDRPRFLADEPGGFFSGVGPFVGLFANTDGGIFGYGGFYFLYNFTRRLHFTTDFGVGGWREGDSKHLGGTFQFLLGGKLRYEFSENSPLPAGSSAGVSIHHFSNAGLHDRNPGINTLSLTLNIPFRGF